MKTAFHFFVALVALIALSSGLSSLTAVTAPVSAFFCVQILAPSNFGVAGGNKTAAQAANTVAGSVRPERTPILGQYHSQKLTDMKKTKSAGVRVRSLDTPCWAHDAINTKFTRRDVVTFDGVAFHAMKAAVVDRNLTPDLGEREACGFAGTSAQEYDFYRRVRFEIPAKLDAAFERLAKSAGMSYRQAFALLLVWVAQHSGTITKGAAS